MVTRLDGVRVRASPISARQMRTVSLLKVPRETPPTWPTVDLKVEFTPARHSGLRNPGHALRHSSARCDQRTRTRSPTRASPRAASSSDHANEALASSTAVHFRRASAAPCPYARLVLFGSCSSTHALRLVARSNPRHRCQAKPTHFVPCKVPPAQARAGCNGTTRIGRPPQLTPFHVKPRRIRTVEMEKGLVPTEISLPILTHI